MLRILIAAGLALAASGAMADEVWNTAIGEVYYEAEVGDTAIFAYPIGKDSGRFYIPGLAGNYYERSIHQGYWIAPGEGACDATLTGADGMTSTSWGSMTIVFHEPGFPDGWTITWGDCFGEKNQALVGAPL